jgi:hypothetical protein
MRLHLNRLSLACSGAFVLMLSGCGGDEGPSTTDVNTTVIDGAIQGAIVCLDKNANGKCDADEVQGKTDAAGHVTLAVPDADVGKYPLIASVGTDAVDADHGPVGVAYTMSAPVDQSAVLSPLTTLVQQTIASTGASTADAARSVQDATGIAASLFQDFTQVAAPTDGSISAATVARMVVVTTQQQQAAVASAIGTSAADGSTIGQADLDKAIQKKLLEMLPSLVTALADPAVLQAATPAAKEAALLTAAASLVADEGLTAAAASVAVAVNHQATVAAPAAAPSAFRQLSNLNFSDTSNYYARLFTGTLAQNTPDASNNARYTERRLRSNAGKLAKWSSGSDPWRNADLNWNGSAWVGCPINHENVSSVRDAQGNSNYTYCDKRETGKSSRATFDIGGKTLAEVYAQIVAAGYTNLSIADPSVLGSTTFPAGSALFYQTNTPLTEAFAYYPAGANNPAGFSNVVTQYSAAVAAGGDASTQAAGTACNSTEATGSGSNSTTLEGLIAAKGGTPCVFGQGTFNYNGTTYTSDTPNEWWGNSTVSLGKIGSVPLNTGTAPGYYSGNVLLRIAFKGTGSNPVTYYACKERFTNGSQRNCTPIGTGSYSIQTLGDGRALTLTNPPAQAAALTYNRVFVERGGLVYFGYQSKPVVTNAARLNHTATTALLAQLGVALEDQNVPLALTAGSYQGTWDLRDASATPSPTGGTTVFINANGSVSCQDRQTSSFEACTLTITDPASGSFSYTNGASTASGSFKFLAGTASGSYHDPSETPADGNFVGGRR